MSLKIDVFLRFVRILLAENFPELLAARPWA
jgi:hypothetical protein